MNTPNTEIVPAQKEGSKSDNDHTVFCKNREEAIQLFSSACKRLLDVNKWETYCDSLASADFKLCDAAGNQVERLAQKGDYFKIDIPGPGPADGDGYDWVQIEEIIELKEEAGDTALVSIQVRPASSPLNKKDSIAHFFSDEATSTFLVQRKENNVTASIHGRNEKPNTDTSVIDKVRNSMIANAAMIRFSDVQWKQLAIGLISPAGQ